MLNKTMTRRMAVKTGGAAVAAASLGLGSFAFTSVAASPSATAIQDLEKAIGDLEFMRASVVRLTATRLSAKAVDRDTWRYSKTAKRARQISAEQGLDVSAHKLQPTRAALDIELAAIQELDTRVRRLRFGLGPVATASKDLKQRLDRVDQRLSFLA